MEFRSQRKLRHRKLKGRKFTFCDFTAFFAGDVLLWSAYRCCCSRTSWIAWLARSLRLGTISISTGGT